MANWFAFGFAMVLLCVTPALAFNCTMQNDNVTLVCQDVNYSVVYNVTIPANLNASEQLNQCHINLGSCQNELNSTRNWTDYYKPFENLYTQCIDGRKSCDASLQNATGSVSAQIIAKDSEIASVRSEMENYRNYILLAFIAGAGGVYWFLTQRKTDTELEQRTGVRRERVN